MALQLDEVLEDLGLSQYLDAFIDQGFDSWDIVLDITESDLDALGVKLGHRRKLQRRIANYRGIAPEVALVSPARPTVEDAPRFEAVPRSDASLYGTDAQGPVPGVSTKRKYRRHPKPDDYAPERPPSAYVLFSNKIREELRDRSLSFTEIAKLVGENWQSLSATEREPFESQAQAAKERYNHDLAEYKKTPEYRNYMAYLQEFKAKHSNQSQDKNAFKRIKLSESGSASASSTPPQSQHPYHQHRRLRQTSPSHRARRSTTRGSRSGSESLREHEQDHEHEHEHGGEHDGDYLRDTRYTHDEHNEHDEHDEHDDHDDHDEHDEHDDHDDHGSHGHEAIQAFHHGREYRVGSISSVSNSHYSASPAQGYLDGAMHSPAHAAHKAHAPHPHAHHTHHAHHSEGSPLRARLSTSPRDASSSHRRQRSESTSQVGGGSNVSLPSLADMFDQRQLGTTPGAGADAGVGGGGVSVAASAMLTGGSPGLTPGALTAGPSSSISSSSSSSSSSSGLSSAMSSASSSSSVQSGNLPRTPLDGTLPIHVLLAGKAAAAATATPPESRHASEQMPSPPTWQASPYALTASTAPGDHGARAMMRQTGGSQYQYRS